MAPLKQPRRPTPVTWSQNFRLNTKQSCAKTGLKSVSAATKTSACSLTATVRLSFQGMNPWGGIRTAKHSLRHPNAHTVSAASTNTSTVISTKSSDTHTPSNLSHTRVYSNTQSIKKTSSKPLRLECQSSQYSPKFTQKVRNWPLRNSADTPRPRARYPIVQRAQLDQLANLIWTSASFTFRIDIRKQT